MKVVVTGLIASYPLGGVAWDYVAYVSGFRELGFEVLYLEDTGQWLYDPRQQTFTDQIGFNLAWLDATLQRARGTTPLHWAVRAPDGIYHGAPVEAVSAFCRDADLFLNVSGACWLREAYRGGRCVAYLDTDPSYSQAKLAAVEHGTASEDQAYSVNLIRAHDRFFTFAESIDRPECTIPHCGVRWIPTRQPIVLDDWPFTFTRAASSYTTVMSWKTDVTLPDFAGVTYGGKDIEFLQFLDLPHHLRVPIEVAVSGSAPRDLLGQHGWHVVAAHQRSHSLDAYRDYLRSSRGEWSVAKNAYVATCSGWFSTRSAAYLALGKPVVVQDTGWSHHLATGDGLFAFRTLDEAATGIVTVERDYLRHCDAARALAERAFAAPTVLTRLLDDAAAAGRRNDVRPDAAHTSPERDPEP